MIGRALGEGVRAATRRPGLVALLWAWNLALAGLVTLPFWAWVSAASSVSPVTDVLLDGADIGVITEMIVADGRVAATLAASVAGLALLALLSGAFLGGGILEVLTSEGDGRPLLHRFFRGAGHFFGRFVRLLMIAAVTAIPVVVLVGAGLAAAARPLASAGSEPTALWAGLAARTGVALVLAFFLLALDYARVITVLTGSRSMVRTWIRGLAFVLRRLPGVTGIALVAGVGVLASIGVAVAFDVMNSARSWMVILGTVVVHQATVLLRTAVRVGHVGAQACYWKELQPVAVAEASPPTEPERAPVAASVADAPPAAVAADGALQDPTEGR